MSSEDAPPPTTSTTDATTIARFYDENDATNAKWCTTLTYPTKYGESEFSGSLLNEPT